MAPRKTNYRIGLLRQRAGLTRAQLGAASGRDAKTIERYENGHVDPPAAVLIKMAAALHTTVDELLNVPSRIPSEIEVNGRRYAAIEKAAEAVLDEAAEASSEAESLRSVAPAEDLGEPGGAEPRTRPSA